MFLLLLVPFSEGDIFTLKIKNSSFSQMLKSIKPERGFLGGASGKEPACQCSRHKRHRFNPRFEKTPWRKAWQLTPVFLPGESHGQRSWQATVCRVTRSQTQLKQLHTGKGREISFNIHIQHQLTQVNAVIISIL